MTKRAKYDSVINNLQIALRNEREAKQIGDDRALAIWSVEVDFLLEQKKKNYRRHVTVCIPNKLCSLCPSATLWCGLI